MFLSKREGLRILTCLKNNCYWIFAWFSVCLVFMNNCHSITIRCNIPWENQMNTVNKNGNAGFGGSYNEIPCHSYSVVQVSTEANLEEEQVAYPWKPHSSLVFCRRSLLAHIGTPLTWLYEHIKQVARASWMQVLKGGWYVSSKSCAFTCQQWITIPTCKEIWYFDLGTEHIYF